MNPVRPHGMDAGVAMVGDIVRYPDGAVTCSPANGLSRLVPDPVVVFEVINPTPADMDRIVNCVNTLPPISIPRYVMVDFLEHRPDGPRASGCWT